MSGTLIGGKKAAATNKKMYGEDFYARIGKQGGHNGKTGGFASDVVGADGLTGRERARVAGRKGGLISRRGPAKKTREMKHKPEPETETPEHGTRESIHRWHSLFRHGKTVMEDENA